MYRTAYIFFISTLLFAPLAFGTVEEWSMTIVQTLVCISAFFLLFSLGRQEIKPVRVPGILPLFLLVLWMFFQVIPLPPFLVKFVSPSTYEIYRPVYEISGQDQWLPLTVNQKATLFECMRVASHALFYFLTVQLLSKGKQLRNVIEIVSYLAIFIAFLAIIQKLTSPDKIYWFRATPENAGTVGPWVYHNHFAGFMEMLCPLVLALFLFYRPAVDHKKTLRSKIAAAFTMPGSNLHFFLGFGIVVIISSIFISLSRGGIISLSLALIFFLAVLPRKIFHFRVLPYGTLLICVVFMITWLGWGAVVDKFGATFTEQGTIYNVRLIQWQDSLNIIGDYFLTGTGFGTFVHIYPQYTTLVADPILDHAHSDYIELLTDGGIIGFSLAAWFVVTILFHGYRVILRRRDRYAILLSVGALAGIVALLIHSFTDFNMHNGANGLYFFFLCGLLISAGNTRLFYRTRSTLLAEASRNTKKVLLVVALVLSGATLFIRGGALLASYNYSKVKKIYLSQKIKKEKLLDVASTAKRASRYDPLEGKYLFALGSAQIFLKQPEEALTSSLEASKKNPLSGIYLQRLALMLATTDKNKAEQLMAIAYARALHKDSLVLTWAEWLLSINEREKAVRILQKVFEGKPLLAQKFIHVMRMYSFSRQEVIDVLPESVSAWVYYGDLVEEQGDMEEAEFFRSHALDFLDREKVIEPWYFSQLYKFYYRQEKKDQALIVLREASKRLPDYARFHVYLGDHYRREGVVYRAIEEYERALLLEPADRETEEKLADLQKKQ